MTRSLLLSVFVAGFVWTSLAQQGPSERGRRDPVPTSSIPERWVWVCQVLDHVVDELQLDEEQQKEYRAIAEGKRERIRRLDWLRWEAVRAERNGDRIRAELLRAGMGEWRPTDAITEVLDELEPVLNEVQYECLIDLRQQRRKGLEDRERFRRISSELPKLLDLDEPQDEQYAQLLKDAMQHIGKLWGELDPLFREMRAAGNAGDFERLDELRREVDAAHPAPEAMLGGFFDALESILRADQTEVAVAYRKELLGSPGREARFDESARPARSMETVADPQQLRRTLLELPEELDLDAAQRADYSGLLADLVAELWSDERKERHELLDGFFEQLEATLRPEQLDRLAAYRSKVRLGPGTAARRHPGDFRIVLRAAKRLRLDRAQRAELRLIERDAMTARRDIDRRDETALNNLARMVQAEVGRPLDEEQTKEFEEQLQRLQRGSRD